MPKRNAKGVSSGVGVPHRMSGRDGDITIRRTRDGKIVYIKEHGSWHPINTGIDVAKLKKDVDRLSRLQSNNQDGRAIITTNLINVRKNTSTATVDPQIKFIIGGTEKFTLGVDDSDSDKFKIDTGGAIGGATKFTMDDSGNVTTAGSLTATKAILSTTANVGDLGTSNGEAGYATSDKIYKINTKGLFVNAANITDSTAFLAIASEADNDAYIQLFDGTAHKWGLGYDQDDAGEFKIFSGVWSSGDERLSLTTAGNLTVAGTITSSAGTLGTGDITGVTLTGDSGGALADTAGSADFTIAGGTNCATSGSGSTITINVDDSFIKNDAADVMTVSDFGANAAFKIDADQPSTAGAEASIGLQIDYDRAVALSGTAAHTDVGIDLDVNSASLGTSRVKGMDIDVVGATSGTHTATGIDLTVSGADTNIGMTINAAGTHMKLIANADADDYATLTVADTGDLTIETVGDGTTDSDLILDVDGDIELNADGGEITLKDDSATFGEFSTAASKTSFKLYESGGSSTDDYLQIVTAAHGATVIKTHDDAAGAANLGFNIDGHIDMNDSPVGFNQFEPTYGGTNTDVDYRTNSNKAFATFGAGSITNVRLYFPAISGNFILLLKQDGTGSRTVTNWNAYDSAGNAAGGSSTVKFAGGSNPTLTTDANHVDIFSFYWDADNEIAYGAATLDFQF
tara:strand:- start:12268 stop:14328 length:2061 start_codon:yes stop_codon:yes gene_type:complete